MEASDAGAGFGLAGPFPMLAGSAQSPAALVDMPELDVRPIPEPQVISLALIGGLGSLFGIYLRKRSSSRKQLAR